MYLASPPGPSNLQNLTRKCKILNVFWTWFVGKGKTEQFNFSNGYKNVKNVIQMAFK